MTYELSPWSNKAYFKDKSGFVVSATGKLAPIVVNGICKRKHDTKNANGHPTWINVSESEVNLIEAAANKTVARSYHLKHQEVRYEIEKKSSIYVGYC